MNYSRYLARKISLATSDATPTMADQSGADDTDINVIVKRYGVYGTVPQGKAQPLYGQDFSELPDNLREAMDLVRGLGDLKKQLPEGLESLTLEELITYSPEAIANIVNPKPKPEEKPETKPEEKK